METPPNISDLTAIYKASKKKFDEDPVFKEKSRLNVVRLQGGDPDCRAVWTLLCDISRAEFQKVYDALGVVVEEVGESFYNPFIPATIKRLQDVSRSPVLCCVLSFLLTSRYFVRSISCSRYCLM